jgi:hypothetical protein
MIMMMLAHIMAETAMISEILVSGVAQCAFDNFSIELTNDPTSETATKNTKLDM